MPPSHTVSEQDRRPGSAASPDRRAIACRPVPVEYGTVENGSRPGRGGGLRLQAYLAARLGRPGESPVRDRHCFQPTQGPVAPGRRPSRVEIDMQQDQLVGRGEPAFVAMVHGMKEMRTLAVVAEQLRGDAKEIINTH